MIKTLLILLSLNISAVDAEKMLEMECSGKTVLVHPKIYPTPNGDNIKFVIVGGGIASDPDVRVTFNDGSTQLVKPSFNHKGNALFGNFFLGMKPRSIIINGCEKLWAKS